MKNRYSEYIKKHSLIFKNLSFNLSFSNVFFLTMILFLNVFLIFNLNVFLKSIKKSLF